MKEVGRAVLTASLLLSGARLCEHSPSGGPHVLMVPVVGSLMTTEAAGPASPAESCFPVQVFEANYYFLAVFPEIFGIFVVLYFFSF